MGINISLWHLLCYNFPEENEDNGFLEEGLC